MITVENNDSYVLINVESKRFDAVFAPNFRKIVFDRANLGCKTIILDLTKVEFIDSSGLGAVVAVLKQLKTEGNLLLCGVCENIRHLLRLTQLDSIFTLYPDVVSAIRAVQFDDVAA